MAVTVRVFLKSMAKISSLYKVCVNITSGERFYNRPLYKSIVKTINV